MSAQQPSYQSRSLLRRPQGVSKQAVINTAKERILVIDLADRLCGSVKMRRVGNKWVARCPLPGHDDKTPSFTVYPETNSYYCFGCLRGGDVVDLAAAAWGYDSGEMAMAAANLLHEFGHEIPPRPERWHRKNERQRPTRDGIERIRESIKRRRLFRIFILPVLDEIGDPTERNEELRRAWDEFWKVPV